MGLFPSALVVSPCVDGKTWTLTDPFEFRYRARGTVRRLVVPRGFQTDFASVPLPFRVLLPPWGRYGYAAVIHDWMYWDQSLSRAASDAVFLDGMKTLAVWHPVRWVIYASVRLFGRAAWTWNREARARGARRVLARLPNEQPATASFHVDRRLKANADWVASGVIAAGRSRYV